VLVLERESDFQWIIKNGNMKRERSEEFVVDV